MSGTIHAGCVVVGEAGILIRGASGSGKSALARSLVDLGHARGLFARLVGDDRIALETVGDRLIARPAAALKGLMEVRGLGLAPTSYEGAAVVRLVVDCLTEFPPRYPDDSARQVVVEGVELPHIALKSGPEAAPIILKALAFMHHSFCSTKVP